MTTSITIASPYTHPHQAARAVLEEAIWPGEVLLGTVRCRLNPGTLADRVFMVGLTPRRFLLVAPDQPERSYSIYRDFVQSVSYEKSGWLHGYGLRIALGGDVLFLSCAGEWEAEARNLVEMHKQCEPDPLYLTSIQFLQQTSDLADLGMLRIARKLLHENMKANPVIEIEPEAAELETRLKESRTALHTGAAIFTFTLLFMIFMAVCGEARLGFSTFLMLPAATGLLRGQQSRRGFALFMAALVALGSIVLNAMSASYINVLMWASFGLAMTLTLSGRPKHSRVAWAMTIFIVGFILVPLAGQIDLSGIHPVWIDQEPVIPLSWL